MEKKDVDELKAYIEGILGGHVVTENMGHCKKCGKWEDLRMGYCFDCVWAKCERDHCPFRQLVYCGQGRKQIFVDLTMDLGTGKIYCDRVKGKCSDQEFAIGLDKEPNLPPVSPERFRFVSHNTEK